jgi:filamentous hemagglutinin family protein
MKHFELSIWKPATGVVMLAFGAMLQAQPTGGVVTSGRAAFGGTSAQMTITQSTPNVAINWQSFGIQAGESVQFVQPSSASVALNRVIGADPSAIMGRLSANGQVFLINPNGILFGPNASVNVGGLVASTVNMSDADLMSGHYGLVGAGAGTVVNQGVIHAANGGSVVLLGSSVNNTGVVQALSAENRQSTVVLLGNMDTGTVSVSGTLDVSGGANQTGGRVVATAHHVGLFNAHINASGDAGGGGVLIGGDYQGQNPAVPNASAVYMSADSAIYADAQRQGNGGRAVLWANDSTRAYGQVSARGGTQSGDGGLIETSGHALDVKGLAVDTRAANGQTGTWLLDPAEVTISSAATTDAAATGGVYAPNTGVSATNVNVSELVTALGSTNVTVTTANTGGSGTGDINVNAAITWTASNTLTLTAARDVNVNQAITGTGGSLVANAGRDVTVAAAITTTTGNFSFNAVQDVKLNGVNTITTGTLSAIAGRNVTVSAAATVTDGNMVFRADNDGTGPSASAGTVAITCGASCLTITRGSLDIRFNPVSYANTSSEISAYGTHLTGGGTLNAKAWVFGQGDNKMYDGTQTATVNGLKLDSNNQATSAVLGSVTSANFDTKHVGTAKPITFATAFTNPVYALFANLGDAVGTYQARANVLVRPLTVSATTESRMYNGTLSSVATPTAAGLQTGDTLNGALTQNFASKDALGTGNNTLIANGTYTVTDGNAGNNYTVAVVSAPGTITSAPLAITANDVSKVYGQTPALTGFTTSTLVNGERVGSVTQSSTGQTAAANVAGSPYAIVASDATGGTFTPGNYSISYVNGALTVTPAAVVPPVIVPPPVVVEPPVVVVPPVVVEPVVPPIVIDPVVTPTVVPPAAVTPHATSTVSVVTGKETMPRIPATDASPALLVVIARPPMAQGPVIFPASVDPLVEQENPPLRLRVLLVRPPKQDRN